MKLIDILIENNLQWPEGADGVVQLCNGNLKFYSEEEGMHSSKRFWWAKGDSVISVLSFDKVAIDQKTAIVTKDQWEKRKKSKMNKPMFANVKVGDNVWDIRMGWGIVTGMYRSSDYPIHVEFEHDSDSYTLDGYLYAHDISPSLFWNEIEIKAPPKPPKSLPELEVDTKVIVWDDGGEEIKRHFSHFDEDGVVHTFYNGMTSFSSSDISTTRWDNWKLAE